MNKSLFIIAREGMHEEHDVFQDLLLYAEYSSCPLKSVDFYQTF